MTKNATSLIIGEIVVDFTLPKPGIECKLRLGGVVHAARGMWACGLRYAVAGVCPKYLVGPAVHYLSAHGCSEFIWLGEVLGSPNVISINDVTEIGDQGYEDLLRDCKEIQLQDVGRQLKDYTEIIIFPGKFDLGKVIDHCNDSANISLDIAYDVENIEVLTKISGRTRAVIISTSSEMFKNNSKADVNFFIEFAKSIKSEVFLLKENRGGSRVFLLSNDAVYEIPAVLSKTVNSVGVGDVYTSVFVGYRDRGWEEAAWRASRAAMYYAQTTYPDDLKRDISRDLNTSLDILKSMGGVSLPWHERKKYSIYLAAPDFSYFDKKEVDIAISSLEYHNFHLRRPIVENGELKSNSSEFEMKLAYQKDSIMINECEIIFAVPLERDPGTLVEIGMAIAKGKPVITYDPRRECNNTMVMAGSYCYSDDLDICLNRLFEALGRIRGIEK